MNTDQKILHQYLEKHPEVAIHYIENLSTDEITALLDSVLPAEAVAILKHIIPFLGAKALERLNPVKRSELISLLPLVIAESHLRAMNLNLRDQILSELSGDLAGHFRRSMQYSKEMVGAYIDSFAISFSRELRLEEALQILRKHPEGVRSRHFIISAEKKLEGFVELKDLVVSDSSAQLKQKLKTEDHTIFGGMNVVDAISSWDARYTELPVTNSEGIFLGTISRSSLLGSSVEESLLDRSAVKAGHALGNLYLIGLTSLFGASRSSNLTSNTKTSDHGS